MVLMYRANTIIIHRADKLGLAQLHQLRGRVGRSYHQAYAYLFFPREVKLKKVAKKRLEVYKNDQPFFIFSYSRFRD